MRCITEFDQRTSPRGDGDHRLLQGIEQVGQLLAAAFELGEALAQPLSGLVQRGLHAVELIVAVVDKAGAQVAGRDAAREDDELLKPPGDATGNPYSQGERHGQRDQAGPESLIAEKHVGAAGMNLQHFANNERKDDKLHRRCLEEQDQEEQAEQLDENFSIH